MLPDKRNPASLESAAIDAEQILDKHGTPTPTRPDIAYGEHERNRIDLYLAKSETPTPLVVHIHGGGFTGGDKSKARASLITHCLEAGISVAAINYRLIGDGAVYPDFMHESARAVQFLRHHAEQWNIDPTRIAVTGNSAGGGISLWLALHDDLADPGSDDPIARQSTRPACAAVVNTQTTYHPKQMHDLLGPTESGGPLMASFFGIDASQGDDPAMQPIFADAAAVTHVSADDPPVLLFYGFPNTPITNDMPDGHKIHHPVFGPFLKKRLKAVGVECKILYAEQYPGENKGEKMIHAEPDIVAFFKRNFRIV